MQKKNNMYKKQLSFTSPLKHANILNNTSTTFHDQNIFGIVKIKDRKERMMKSSYSFFSDNSNLKIRMDDFSKYFKGKKEQKPFLINSLFNYDKKKESPNKVHIKFKFENKNNILNHGRCISAKRIIINKGKDEILRNQSSINKNKDSHNKTFNQRNLNLLNSVNNILKKPIIIQKFIPTNLFHKIKNNNNNKFK